MMMITSRENSRFKLWKKLKTKKGRDRQGLFLAEGEHLVEEAIKAGWPIAQLIIRQGSPKGEAFIRSLEAKPIDTFVLSPSLYDELSGTETSQGLLAVIQKPKQEPSHLTAHSFLLLVDQVQDPGNLGTMIRTADAAGVDAVLLGAGTVDPFNEKVVRSTQGSLFHLPLYQGELLPVVDELKQNGWLVVGSAVDGALDLYRTNITPGQKLALIVGNEGQGISPELLHRTSFNVKIPLWGKAESLNVSVACGILLYHFQFQRLL